ncbi:GyrI-like domain-containing protein [Enterococcus sp.]|uniref:GyrI-like domain-containing protein n=1 Tax=Enterococcus sp. TaxID=35783 RepID=UPI0028A00FDA|nr:GyrI-like domain-containing protein [Enterococcus sp.]
MELGEVIRVDVPAFYVIGKEGKGLAEDGGSWVPALWELATKDFQEIEFLVSNQEAKDLEFWGLMSDGDKWLEPWQETGRYLAGVKVLTENFPPVGWVRWEIPAMSYLAIKTDERNLGMMTEKMLSEVLPENKVQLAAAIQERYLPHFKEGEVELFFPVEPEETPQI